MRNSSGVPQGKPAFARTPIGGTGWTEGGIQFSAAGDLIAGGDSNGCWIRPNGAALFNDLMKTTILPSGSYGPGIANNTPNSGGNYGCGANAIYSANGNIGYFVFNANIYKLTNLLSATPTATLMPGGPYTPFEANLAPRPHFARQMAIDPQNSNYMMVGNYGTSLVYTTDGATLTTITVPANATSGGNPTPHLVAVDPHSTVSGGQHQIWYYTVYGGASGGVYRSTTGINGTYSLVTGSPNKPCSLKVDPNGNVWVLNDGETSTADFTASASGTVLTVTAVASGTLAVGQTIWNGLTTQSGNWTTITSLGTGTGGTGTYNLSQANSFSSQETWTNPGNIYKAAPGGSFAKVPFPSNYNWTDSAINPANTSELVVIDSNFVLGHSLDGGVTWIGNGRVLNTQLKMYPQTAGWMKGRNATGTSQDGPSGMYSGGEIAFHPTSNYLYVGGGRGVLKCLPPATNVTWYWQEDTAGIEQFVTTSICVPPGGKPIYTGGDFSMMEIIDGTYAGTISSIPQPSGGSGDETAWHVSWVPNTPNFQVASVGYWHNAHAYRDRRTNPAADWTCFPGTFPVSGAVYGGGPLLAPTVTDFYFFPIANMRPVSIHSLTGNWSYEDVNMPGMNTKAVGYIGAGTSQLIIKSVANYDGTNAQQYTVTFNAASGTGTVVDNAGAKTVTVTPAAGATAAQTATLINANSAMITAAATGTGAGAVPAGTVSGPNGSPATTLGWESGWGWFPIFYVTTVFNSAIDSTNGDICAFNYGDGTWSTNAPWAGIWKRSQSGGTWSRVANCPMVTSAPQMRHVYGQAGHFMLAGAGLLYRTTNAWTSNSQVGNGSFMFANVGAVFCGASAPGQTYPAIYVNGSLNGVYGLWICDDGSWTNWRNLGQYPGNYVYPIGQGAASLDTYGKVELGYSGGGIRGSYSFPFTTS